MRSPFKFLDPFTVADKDVFFGRDKETQQLYRQVLRTRLLLLYGLSGTGKTSLIQCGLGNKFDGPDWLPLWIRKQADINESLQASIRRLLPAAEGEITDQIRQLYQHFLRPVYLIFDQFEELFILGTPDERVQFVKTLKAILDEELPCTVLLVIREEYLGRLYPFEQAIPNLFDFRLRVEPMDNANVKTVLRKSFQTFNISVEELAEEPKEARLDEIIQNVSQERSRIELPYLQVYLDQLYREDYDRTYPNKTALADQSWLPIEFTKDEIEEFGTIDKVLDTFLDEQIQLIQDKLLIHNSTTLPDMVKLVLDGFVSEEGTKRPVRYMRIDGNVVIDHAQQDFFPTLPDTSLTICLNELEKAKILRSEYDVIEIAHDSLAQIIDNKRTAEERERNNMKRQIRLAADMFPKTGEYLTPKQLAKFDDVLPQLTPDETSFFLKSKQVREEEEDEELEKERQRSAELEKALENTNAAKRGAEEQTKIAQANEKKAKRRGTWAVIIAVIAAIFLIGASLEWNTASQRQKEAVAANAKADSALAKNQHIIDAFYFYNDRFALALKEIDGKQKYGFIDKNGDFVIDPQYDEATPFDEYDGFARVKRNGQKYLLDTLKHECLLAQDVKELNDQTIALDLHDKQIDIIPLNLFKYPKLSLLLLYNNNLKELPAQIGKLKSLQRLYLSSNKQLTSLPAQIGELKSLQRLSLSGTSLTSLPAQIGELTSLQRLSLSSNKQLTSLPAQIWKLKSLQRLSLSGTSLTSLPIQIGELTSLQWLDLSSTFLTSLPAQIGELTSLQWLSLSSTSLTSLPAQIGKLKSLQRLDLSSTSLTSLPVQIGKLKSLQRLSLSSNKQLTSLPAQIGELTSLQWLSLSSTSLTSLPAQIGELKSLQWLSLSFDKQLTSLPTQIGDLKSLQTLYLSGTSLTSLPMQIGDLQSLQTLDLSNSNKLTSLPTQIGDLKSLQTLDLSSTSLTSLPYQIGGLKSLQRLNLIFNTKLTSLPAQIGDLQSLQTLDLSNNNKLTSLPTQIGDLKSLQRLYLSSTLLTSLPTQIGDLKSLQILDLSDNYKLISLPARIGELKSLQKLYLSSTSISEEEIKKIKEWLPNCEIITGR